MKKTVVFLTVLLLFGANAFNAQTWEWATKLEGTLGATDQVVVKGVDVDAFGNSYVTGYYTGQLNSAAANNSSQQDGFVAKFNTSGALQWAHKFGGPGNDAGNAISVETYTTAGNPQGVFYITGYVQYNDPASVTFNGSGASQSLPSVTACLSAASPNNIYLRGGLSSKQVFVAKYSNLNGTVQWVKPIYSASCLDGEGLGICASFRHSPALTNYDKDVYVTGYFEGNSASFMQSSPCTFTTVNGNTGNKTAFVAKLSGSSGNALWAKSLAVPTNANAMSVGKNIVLDRYTAVTGTLNAGLFITGDYQAAANVGGTTLTNTGVCAYVAHLYQTGASTGTALWVKEIQSAGATANVQARDINCVQGSSDDLFALGDFVGGIVSSGTATAANGGGREIYLFKMSKATGTTSIARSEGGADDQYAYGMDISLAGGAGGAPEIFVSGSYSNSITFTGGLNYGFYGTAPTNQCMFKYDVNMTTLCAAHWDADMNLYPQTLNPRTMDACDIAASKTDGSAYLGGLFLNSESPVFSPQPALSTSKPASGFIAKWLCCACPAPTISVNRPTGSTTATVSFTYPPCDYPTGAFNLWHSPMVQPVPWGTPSITVSGLDPSTVYNWVATNNCDIASRPETARTTSGKEINAAADLSFEVYPNPSDHTVNFESNQTGSVEIYNIMGQLVKTTQLTGASRIHMDVNELPSGNYVCKFISQNNSFITKKIQVIH